MTAPRVAISGLILGTILVIGTVGGTLATTNKIGGKVVDRARQAPLGDVRVVFHAVGYPKNVFDTLYTQKSGEKVGRYETTKIDRQNAVFAVQYTKDNYIGDGRTSVANDVWDKELDSVALVSIDAAVEVKEHLVAGLRAVVRFVAVSQDAKKGQETVDTLKNRAPTLFKAALAESPDIGESFKRVGLVA